MRINSKSMLWVVSALCVASLLIAYIIMQKALGLAPCPLCILDRFAVGFILLGSISILLIRLRIIGSIIIAFGLVVGLASTIRHVWLERFPSDGGCLFPSQEPGIIGFVLDAFASTADCSSVPFRFVGFSIAEMTLALFLVLGLLCLGVLIQSRRH